MKIKFLIILVSFFQFGFSQNVSIKLNFENVSDSVAIVASKSINNDAAYYLSNTDTIYTKSNQATLSFNSINSGYMNFSFSKINPGISVLFEPDDNIILNITKNQDNKYNIHYIGKNSDILLLINTDTVYKYQKLSKKLRPIIFEANRGSDILNVIKSEYKNALSKLQSLYDENKISNQIFQISKLYLETTLADNSKGIIEDIFRIEEEFSKTKLPKSEFIDLLNNLMFEFNPFNEKFNSFASISFFNSLQATSKFIKESGTDEKVFNKNLWKNKNAREYYNYIPLQYQEKLFAYLFVNDRLNEDDLKQFKKIFPNSKYYKYLENYLKNKNVATLKPLAHGYFINNNFEYINQIKSYDISSIIKDNFQGKPVFVDLWAAYCAPCFQEFSHSQKLFAFLKTNNIEILYIAIDNDKEIAKWEPNIKQNYLEGNHVFASNKIQESLQILLNEPQGVYIPRYLLFNSKGNLVLPNTKKPSEGELLYNQILEALK